MRRRLLRWLACPSCRQGLQALAAEERRRPSLSREDRACLERTAPLADPGEIEAEILSGALSCSSCRVYYPIYRGIPRMLGYPTGVAAAHARENAAWLARHLGGFSLPRGAPPPGEERVLKGFSVEWEAYHWTGAHYWDTTPENMLTCKRYELGTAKHALRGKLLLEVGIGIGGTADSLARSEDCEIIGMDLSHAVDQAWRHFGENPRLHIVQASAFAPPFAPGVFDAVYSHGVLHHTHSTREAFRTIAGLPKPRGGMLYIWVYSREQERATPLRRALMALEAVARPILSRLPTPAQTLCLLPALPFYILYQNLYRRPRAGRPFAAVYGWNQALHAARDRLTPFFAHRHSYDEVLSWFRSEDYGSLEMLREETPPQGVPATYPLNVGVRGFRR